MKLYSVNNWSGTYETHETAKLKALKWVPVPNKHDGLTYRKIGTEKDGAELYAAWILIVQIASKSDKDHRGQLVRNGRPMSPRDMALVTGFPESIFSRALAYYTQDHVGWMDVEEYNMELPLSPGDTGESPGEPGSSPEKIPAHSEKIPLNRKEGKGRELLCVPASPERRRDELFDALGAVSGADPGELTANAARACCVALAQIRKVSPTVTREEIARRAANYQTHFADAAITPSALANHWATCAHASTRGIGAPQKTERSNFTHDDYSKFSAQA